MHAISEVSWIVWFYELLASVFEIGYELSRKYIS